MVATEARDFLLYPSMTILLTLYDEGDKSVEEVRQLYFKMKSEVFTGGSYGFNTDMLEKILQETFPSHMTMNCPTTHSTKLVSCTLDVRFFCQTLVPY